MKLNKEELEALVKLVKTEYGEVYRDLETRFKEILDGAKDYKYCLWNFEWDVRRQGIVEGTFLATKEQVENIQGQHVSFGEIRGKHSDIYGTIEEGEITLVSDDPFVVMDSESSGYNPFDYLRCKECSEEIDPETFLCEYCDKEEGE
jgi:hypothetical protein